MHSNNFILNIDQKEPIIQEIGTKAIRDEFVTDDM